MEQIPVPRDPRSIDVGPTFLAGIQAGLKNYLPLLGIYAICTVPMIAVFLIGCPTLFGDALMAPPGTRVEIPGHEWIVFAGCLVFALGLGSWTYAAAAHLADVAMAGGASPGIQGAFGETLERVPAVIGTYVVIVAVVLVGTLFCILPGIYLAYALHLAPLRAVTRARGPIESVREVYGLVKGRWWRVFGFMILLGLAVQAIYLPVMMPLQLLGPAMPGVGAFLLVAFFALALLLGVFQITCMVALHRRLEQLGPVDSPRSGATPPIDDTPAPEPV